MEPVTRRERYLAAIAESDGGELPAPVTRIEEYLAAIAGSYDGDLPAPVTREEHYLAKIAENGGGGGSFPPVKNLVEFLTYWFPTRATGELFTRSFYRQSVSASGIGTAEDDAVGLKCEPSTDVKEGVDDFATHNAFWWTDCNFIVDDNGVRIPTVLDGQPGFTRTGKVQVGVLTPPLYWGEEKTDTVIKKYFSDKKNPKNRPNLTLTLCPWCRDAYGNPMPYGIVPKYYAGEIDGMMYGSSGLMPKLYISYNLLHTEVQKLGKGYLGSGAERSAYLKNFLWIKYGTLSSTSKFRGNTGNNYQYKAAAVSAGERFFTVKATEAKNLYVGGAVSIGDPAGNMNLDRGQSYMHNIKKQAKISDIVTDGENAKIYLDGAAFDVTETSYLSTMPLASGQTDAVLGSDGYLVEDWKHSYKIQGVEEGIGAHYVSANEVMDKTTATQTDFYIRTSQNWNNGLTEIKKWKKTGSLTREGTTDFFIGETRVDLETGAEVPLTEVQSDAQMTGDRFYFGGVGTGTREYLTRGHLSNGSHAGLSCVSGWNGLSAGDWNFAACVS